MPFDGRQYTSQALIYPSMYGSGVPAQAVASMWLRGAYFVCRNHGRRIGEQTYWQSLNIPARTYANPNRFVRSTWVDVAKFRRYVPSWATHLAAECQFSVFAHTDGEMTAHHRIVVTDGVDTDTGDDFETPRGDAIEYANLDIRPDNGRWLNGNAMNAFDLFAPNNPALTPTMIAVELSSVGSGATMDVTVQGYATESDDSAAPYLPVMYTGWWLALG